MFHLIIGLMAMGMFAVVIAIVIIPLWLGPLVQVLVSLFSKGRVARWIPSIFGVIGLCWSIYSFMIKEPLFPIWGILLYWVVYALLLWGVHTLSDRLREWVRNRKGAEG